MNATLQPPDLMARRAGTPASYRALLESLLDLGLPPLTHQEAIGCTAEADRYVCIRHDVSGSLEIAVLMARLEHAAGIAATYVLMPPEFGGRANDSYGSFDGACLVQAPRLREVVRELTDLGHEIVLCSDFLVQSDLQGRPAAELLREQLAYFRGTGVTLRATASCMAPPQSLAARGVDAKALGVVCDIDVLRHDALVADGPTGLTSSNGPLARGSADIASALGTTTKLLVRLSPAHWDAAHASRRPPAASPAAEPAPDAATSPSGPRFVRADGQPFRIGIRGDCCSRRAIAMNKALFPRGVKTILNEKSPTRLFVDAAAGASAGQSQGDALCDTDAMPATLRHYFESQFDRSLLDADDLDLLVIDSYADMHFELWRHRAEKWSLWIHRKFLRDPDVLKTQLEHVGRASLDEAVASTCWLIDHVRRRNPGVPVLMLTQPVEHYPNLASRREFYELGRRVAALRPGVHAAPALVGDDLVPDDVGSCGPGLTLHFDGPTYLRMIEGAWADGLGEHFRGTSGAGPASTMVIRAANAKLATERPTEPAAAPGPALEAAAGVAHMPSCHVVPPVGEEGLPNVCLSYGQGRNACAGGCAGTVEAAERSLASYFRHPETADCSKVPRWTPMLMSTEDIRDYDVWESYIRTTFKDRMPLKRKAVSLGFYVKPFAWKLFIPDVHEINHSKTTRSGGPMRGSYLASLEKMGGAPDRHIDVKMPSCTEHWGLTFGTFVREEGRMQGTVRVDERLLAYISLRRFGDLALYSQILGHGDFLKPGALVLLHHEVVRWLSEHRDDYAKGLRFLMYGGQQNGTDGLFQFKRRSGFTARHVYAYRGEVPPGASGTQAAEMPTTVTVDDIPA
jgi:hypothetical protein